MGKVVSTKWEEHSLSISPFLISCNHVSPSVTFAVGIKWPTASNRELLLTAWVIKLSRQSSFVSSQSCKERFSPGKGRGNPIAAEMSTKVANNVSRAQCSPLFLGPYVIQLVGIP